MAPDDDIYECQSLDLELSPFPTIIPEPHDPPPPSVQLELTIAVDLNLIRHYCSLDHFTAPRRFLSSQETLLFDLHRLRDPPRFTQILGSSLTRLGIIQNSPVFNFVFVILILYGIRLSSYTHGMGRRLFRLHATLRGTYVRHVDVALDSIQRDLVDLRNNIRRALAGFRNHGMVPAKESSVEEMLKQVRVVGIGEIGVEDQDCVICLEGFEVGSIVSQIMPCSHKFHENCIRKWLKQSHYCPTCRFELPTENS